MAAQATNFKIGNANAHCGNITGSFNKTVYKSDEDAQIMRWLSPLEPNNRHEGVRSNRFDGVGGWLLETGEFRKWRGSEGGADKAVLFCSGNPGVGKTYLSSLVIDCLCDQARKEDIAVVGLYCDYLAQEEQTITDMMGAMLKHLLGRGDIPNYLREAFHEEKKGFGGRRLPLTDLMGKLKIAIASVPQVFICIDALDECLPKHLPKLLELLRDIILASPNTRIFLTGRPHVEVDIQRYFTKAVVIPISPNIGDIRSYLEMRLAGDTEPEAMNNELREDIVKIIVERISDIFLLVSLNMDAILGEVTIRQRRKKLEEMTKGNGLSDVYATTLTRLKAQKGKKSALGLKVLMWVLYSERPLRADELCHALGVEIGSADLDVENVPALRTVVVSCLGLVVVEWFSPTVRLVHCTLQEHLLRDPTLFHSPHSEIAEVCLTYLHFRCVRDISPTLDLDLARWAMPPLLKYASYYWGEHARKGMTDNVKLLASGLLDGFDEHICAQLTLLRYGRSSLQGLYPYCERRLVGFTGLHGVAFLGIAEIAAAILGMKEWDVNATDSIGCTPVIWAAIMGHEEVIRVLLERQGLDLNKADTMWGLTPLLWAARLGNEGVAKVLLKQEDVSSDQTDTKSGRTPLSWAAERGHEVVVIMLLQREGANPDTAGPIDGRTPLSWAAEGGHDGVVKALLEREGVNPDAPDTKYGWTPLLWAAESGREGVVKMLLERKDVNPDQVDTKSGRTPLSWAAGRGRGGVAKLLLGQEGVNPNTADTKYGRTPLSWAARYGYQQVVEVLLKREGVNPNQADTEFGRTPLLWAAVYGHEGVVKMLLRREDANPNMADPKYGLTALSWAARHGHQGVVEMLLGREGVNPDQADTEYGRTPLSWASIFGHGGVVKVLLQREDVNPNTTDTEYGRTPLSLAAEEGHEVVVKMLLEREGVNPDLADPIAGRTPLSWAAGRGHWGVVKVLLRREDVNPNTADTKYGRTPLSWAAEHGYWRVVEMLLERGDVNPDQADTRYGRTPLSWAAQYGWYQVVEVLLKREDINPDTADTKHGRTPLSWAAEHGYWSVVEMLLERGDVNPDQADTESGRTPLSWAAGRGCEGVVRVLLKRRDVNPDRADTKFGRTPLTWAAMHGHERVVKLFLGRKRVRTTLPSKYN